MTPKFFGQKFTFALLVLGISTAALFTGHLTEGVWQITALTALGMFGGFNVASKFFRPDPRLAAALGEEDDGSTGGNPSPPAAPGA